MATLGSEAIFRSKEEAKVEKLIEHLPSDLRTSVRLLLETATKFRAKSAIALADIDVATRRWQVLFEHELDIKKDNIMSNLALQSEDSARRATSLVNGLLELKRWILREYSLRDELPASVPSASEASLVLQEFKAGLVALEEQESQRSVHLPWEIKFAGERDPAAEPGAEGSAVNFGGQIMSPDGSILFEDSCCVCKIVIQSGFLFGKDSPRVHCLDCSSHATICMFCSEVLNQITGGSSSTLDESIRLQLFKLNPHITHRLVVEHSESVMIRNSVCEILDDANSSDANLREHDGDSPDPICSLPEMMANAFALFCKRPCFGRIQDKEDVKTLSNLSGVGGVGAFSLTEGELSVKNTGAMANKVVQYSTYEFEFNNRIIPISRSLGSLKELNIHDRIAISFHGSRLFYDIEMSIFLRRFSSANVSSDWSDNDWVAVAARAQIAVAFISQRKFESLSSYINNGELPNLKYVIIVDEMALNVEDFSEVVPLAPDDKNIKDEFKIENVQVFNFQNFLAMGANFDGKVVLKGLPDDETIIFHSSGTTGAPKGVIQDARRTIADFNMPIFTRPIIEFSYLPPFWGTDKLTVWRTIFNGGCVAFALSSDMSSLFSQVSVVRPTTLIMVPTIAKSFQVDFQAILEDNVRKSAKLFNNRDNRRSEGGQEADSKNIQSEYALVHAQAKALDRVNDILGDRCKIVAIGGAKTPADVMLFMKAVTPAAVIDVYGTSESSGITSNNIIVPNVKVKLLDRPDLGYTNDDKPFPRGEICVKDSISQIQQNQWLCSEAERVEVEKRYLPEGYFCTGDIGVMPSPRELIVIDRASSLIKLASGIFVSPEKIEECLIRINGVVQLLVLPNVTGTILVAIIVLEEELRKRVSADLSSATKEWLLKFRELGAKSGLAPHELPQVIIFENENWTVLNKSLLPNHKINRRAIKSRHTEQLSNDFVVGDSVDVDRLYQEGSVSSPFDTVLLLISQSIGISSEQLVLDVSLHAQGVDSIAFIRVINSLHEFGIQQMGRGAMIEPPPRLLIAEAARSTPFQLASRWVSHATGIESTLSTNLGIWSETTTGKISKDEKLKEFRPTTEDQSNSIVIGGSCKDSSSADMTNRPGNSRSIQLGSISEVENSIPLTSLGINNFVDNLYQELTSSCIDFLRRDNPLSSPSRVLRDAVFVTGATGYFGKFLVVDFLLSHSSSDPREKRMFNYSGSDDEPSSTTGERYETMICLVRGKNSTEAKNRLREALLSTRKISANEIDSAFQRNLIEVVLGDIAKPNLGSHSSMQDLFMLSQRLVMIIHAAAAVKFYDSTNGLPLLLNPNVVGTAEVLKLSILSSPHVPFKYISTFSCSNPDTNIQTNSGQEVDMRDDFFSSHFKADFHTTLDAYSMSKHIAEVLVRKVFSQCLSSPSPSSPPSSSSSSSSSSSFSSSYSPSKEDISGALAPSYPTAIFEIIRLPLLTWSREGACNNEDWLQRLLDTCKLIKLRPLCSEVSTWNTPINYLCVDVCARLVLEVGNKSGMTEQAMPNTIDLISSSATLTVKSVLEEWVESNKVTSEGDSKRSANVVRCNSGHSCSVSSTSVGIYTQSWSCDICNERGFPAGSERWNCVECSFDACLSCQPHSKTVLLNGKDDKDDGDDRAIEAVRDFSFLKSVIMSNVTLPFSPLASTFLLEITEKGSINNSVIFETVQTESTPFKFDSSNQFKVDNNWRFGLKSFLMSSKAIGVEMPCHGSATETDATNESIENSGLLSGVSSKDITSREIIAVPRGVSQAAPPLEEI